jgi:hypothetical protein
MFFKRKTRCTPARHLGINVADSSRRTVRRTAVLIELVAGVASRTTLLRGGVHRSIVGGVTSTGCHRRDYIVTSTLGLAMSICSRTRALGYALQRGKKGLSPRIFRYHWRWIGSQSPLFFVGVSPGTPVTDASSAPLSLVFPTMAHQFHTQPVVLDTLFGNDPLVPLFRSQR